MKNIAKLLGIVILIAFFIMVFTSSSGYYEYELNKKSNLTQDAIEQFEQDIRDGKKIDMNDYYIKENKDYSNGFSKVGLELSNKIGKVFASGVKFIFTSLNNLVNE